MIIAAIATLSILSYFTGVSAVLKGDYKPSLYSRAIWLLLAINGLIGLTRLEANDGVIALSTLQTLGSFIIFIAALKYTILKFGRVEWISTILLIISGGFWLFGDFPAINVAITLIAHFVGGIPTFAAVIKDPRAEKTMFWGYFALASLISLIFADKSNFAQYMFPLYFSIINISIFGLSVRHKIIGNSKTDKQNSSTPYF